MKSCRRPLALLCALIFCAALLSVSVFAAGSIDIEKGSSLTLTYRDGKTPLKGANFSIYLVAEVDEFGELYVRDEFSQFNVDIRGENDEAWRLLASTLEGYVLRDRLTPIDSGETDSRGMLSFPTDGGELLSGLYLVLGRRHIQNDRYYDAAPFMIMLPSLDKENNTWDYSPSVFPKNSSRPIPDEPEEIKRKVIKLWVDENGEEIRPADITVQLLRDGEVYDTATLSEDNGWQYEWNRLDGSSKWNLVELVPDGYTTTIDREGVTFVVVNTLNETNPGNPPSPPPASPPAPGGPMLPQTGQLWWPVPTLLSAGLLLVILGLLQFRGKSDEK